MHIYHLTTKGTKALLILTKTVYMLSFLKLKIQAGMILFSCGNTGSIPYHVFLSIGSLNLFHLCRFFQNSISHEALQFLAVFCGFCQQKLAAGVKICIASCCFINLYNKLGKAQYNSIFCFFHRPASKSILCNNTVLFPGRKFFPAGIGHTHCPCIFGYNSVHAMFRIQKEGISLTNCFCYFSRFVSCRI